MQGGCASIFLGLPFSAPFKYVAMGDGVPFILHAKHSQGEVRVNSKEFPLGDGALIKKK